jgi:hypothetical protein
MDIQNKPASSIVRWRINLSNLQDTGIQDGDQFSLDGLSTRFRLKFRYFDENFEYWLYVVNMGFEKNVKCTVNFWAENRYREKSYETESKYHSKCLIYCYIFSYNGDIQSKWR